MKVTASLAWALLCSGIASVASAQTTLLAPVADTYLRSGSANQAQGGATALQVQSSGKNRALIAFDPAAIQAAVGSGSLAAATLELYIVSNGDNWGGGRTVDAHRLTAAWTENGATWNCPVDSNPGNSNADCAAQWAGGAFEEEPSDTVLHTDGLAGWVSYDVTGDVQGLLAGTTSHHGWLVKKTEESQNGRVDYGSRQGVAGQAPRLRLVVESASFDQVPPRLALTGPGSPWINDTTPAIGLAYGDAGSGIDLASLQVTVDGVALAVAACVKTATAATCESPALAAGSHQIAAQIADAAGNTAEVQAVFELLLGPGLSSAAVAPAADTYLRQGQPNQPDGDAAMLEVRHAGKNRALLRFDPAAIAASVGPGTLRSATLVLSITGNGRNWGPNGRAVDLHRLLAAWSEAGATWNCASDAHPTNVQADCSPQWDGGTYATPPLASATITSVSAGELHLDLSAEIAALLAGGGPHHGFLLKKREEGQAGLIELGSREGSAAAAPRLVLTFELPDVGGPTDQTPPELSLLYPSTARLVGNVAPDFRFGFEDADSGIDPASFTIALDGLDLLAGCSVDTFEAACAATEAVAGPHLLTASVRDLAGNLATISFSYEQLVDLEAPLIALASPADGLAVRTATVTVSGSVGDDTELIALEVDGKPLPAVLGAFSTEIDLRPGLNEIAVSARDRTGRTSRVTREVVLDLEPPHLRIESPQADQRVNGDAIRVAFSVTDNREVALVELQQQAVTPDAEGYFESTLTLGAGESNVVVRALDRAGNQASATIALRRATLPAVYITQPADLSTVVSTSVTVAGTVSDPQASVLVNGVTASVAGGSFVAEDVPLIEGGNIVTATADAGGNVGTYSIQVVRDSVAPRLAVHWPHEGATLLEPAVTVSGMVNDVVTGTVNEEDATVSVNGIPATVDNRSFVATSVPLASGANTLTVVTTDRTGNTRELEVHVTRREATGARVVLISGDGQTAEIGSELEDPLVVEARDAAGLPQPGVPVLFQAGASNGFFAGGRWRILVTTDAAGRASARYTVGTRAGVGNEIVQASIVGADGPVAFTASVAPGAPAKLVVDSGDQQEGLAGHYAPRPLVAVVTDRAWNRLAGVPVRFEIVLGQGALEIDSTEATLLSDSDGRAITVLQLEQAEGIANNVVKVTLAGQPDGPAVSFTASGKAAGPPADTSISGVVLDNSDLPIAGVTLRVLDTPLAATTDVQGQFRIAGAPVGTVRLVVDGSTAQRPGAWPDLEFILTTVPGRDNTVTMPIYLLPLDLQHGVQVDETRGATLRLPDLPGFALEILPGSVTFPGGGRTGLVSVTTVHSDKVPMVPSFGQQPRLIVTIQPAGALFDPPARLTVPNVSGYAPGQVTEMYSFDHDLSQFVSIGPATTSRDGGTVTSNPGVGILKAGWHATDDPDDPCFPSNCRLCEERRNGFCEPVPTSPLCNDGNECTRDFCRSGLCLSEPIKKLTGIEISVFGPEPVRPDWTDPILVNVQPACPGFEVTFKNKKSEGSNDSGHVHSLASRPAGTFSPSKCTTQSGGYCFTEYRTGEFAGHFHFTAENQEVKEEDVIQVGVSGLIPLFPGATNFRLIGGCAPWNGDCEEAPRNLDHPDNHYVTPEVETKLTRIADEWAALHPNAPSLLVNDCSLEFGGRFDIEGKWAGSHAMHRAGKEIDVSFRSFPTLTLRNQFNAFCNEGVSPRRAIKCEEHGDPKDHFHIYF